MVLGALCKTGGARSTGNLGNGKDCRICEHGLQGQSWYVAGKNRPHKCPNGPGAVKTDIGGIWKPKRAEMGAGTAKIAKNAKIRRKTANLTNGTNGEVKSDRADVWRAWEGPRDPFACICVHLRSIFGAWGLSDSLKTAIRTANGRKGTQMGTGTA